MLELFSYEWETAGISSVFMDITFVLIRFMVDRLCKYVTHCAVTSPGRVYKGRATWDELIDKINPSSLDEA